MKGNIIYKKIIPARSPEYAEFPESLHPDIRDFLAGQNIKALYTHQAEAFFHAMDGENVVITTPTASGKSLCFYLPVVEEILKNHITANPSENFSIAIGDIDFFKKVNDTYGHNCGDQVLTDLAKLFKEKTLGLGHVCRWGGEEFLFFFPGLNLDEASTLMDNIRLAISDLTIVYKDVSLHVTMTFGLEEYDYNSSPSEMVKHADDKLYYGKTHGRDTVIF